MELDKFTIGYIGCAFWSSTDDNDDPLDRNYERSHIHAETLEKMVEDCTTFQKNGADLLSEYYEAGYDVENAGHDFWLTRNGHGAGFWDKGLGELGEKLSKLSKSYGEYDLIIGDDGLVYGI